MFRGLTGLRFRVSVGVELQRRIGCRLCAPERTRIPPLNVLRDLEVTSGDRMPECFEQIMWKPKDSVQFRLLNDQGNIVSL